MDWLDEGILLSNKAYGENSALITIFTSKKGLHSGIVKGTKSKHLIATLQPSNQVSVRWYGRLEEHLGNFKIELSNNRAAIFMTDKLLLAGYNAVAAICLSMLPDRQAMPMFYGSTKSLLDQMIINKNWLSVYLKWELKMLSEMGFGLDLSTCVVSASKDNLIYISPKSGRAVSEDSGKKYSNKLLPFPESLKSAKGYNNFSLDEVVDGLKTTGFFIEKWLVDGLNFKNLIEVRTRFMRMLLA